MLAGFTFSPLIAIFSHWMDGIVGVSGKARVRSSGPRCDNRGIQSGPSPSNRTRSSFYIPRRVVRVCGAHRQGKHISQTKYRGASVLVKAMKYRQERGY